MTYKIIKLNEDNRIELSNRIKDMEKDIYYPLGDDYFKIDHGEDYFAFFERLGDLHYWCAFDGDKLIGVAAGIIRTINNQKVWYLCDLKVIKEYRGKGIPRAIFKKAFIYNIKKHRIFKAYAVSMNSNNNKNNFKLIKKITFGLLKNNGLLKIYSLTKNDYYNIFSRLNKHSIINTKNKKDLILKSTNKKLKLYHYNEDVVKENKDIDIPNDATIMFSAVRNSNMDLFLRKEGLKSDSDAIILSFRVKGLFNVFTDEI